jgi:ABC-type transporter Mla subunit MlaD
MKRPTAAREAPIVEALGEMAGLVDRVEALTPSLNRAQRALARASADLAQRADAFDGRMQALANDVETEFARHLVRRASEVTRHSLEAQSRAMADTAHSLFKSELHPALRHLAVPLQQLVDRLDRPWESWVMHAATATVASVLTLAAVLYVIQSAAQAGAARDAARRGAARPRTMARRSRPFGNRTNRAAPDGVVTALITPQPGRLGAEERACSPIGTMGNRGRHAYHPDPVGQRHSAPSVKACHG